MKEKQQAGKRDSHTHVLNKRNRKCARRQEKILRSHLKEWQQEMG